MAERPIPFRPEMVRAILDGTKTQTRRLLKPVSLGLPVNLATEGVSPELCYSGAFNDPTSWGWPGAEDGADAPISLWPEWWGYRVGDTLWVREAWGINDYRHGPKDPIPKQRPDYLDDDALVYFATEDDVEIRNEMPRRSSIHMPRWASRITLRVTDVRVQRLQDISEEDAKAEGTQEPSLRDLGGPLAQAAWSERQVFSRLWENIHGLGAWDANPWVAAVSFELTDA